MPFGSKRSRSDDPWLVLGLAPGSPPDAINEARRGLAKRAHPDVGGSVAAMQRINDAADEALRLSDAGAESSTQAAPVDGRSTTGRHPRPPQRVEHARYDHPSFTVEALPADTYEGLSIVATWLGEVLLDEPPYEMEVVLHEPLGGWCRLDVVPDAGASTVSLTVGALPGARTPDLDAVRDAWIDGLNRLDWSDPDGNGPTSQGV